jgi:hypothetical protein
MLWVRSRTSAGAKGRQDSLQSLLCIAIAAMLAGAKDRIAMFRGGGRLRPEVWLVRILGIDSGQAPAHAPYHCFSNPWTGIA